VVIARLIEYMIPVTFTNLFIAAFRLTDDELAKLESASVQRLLGIK